MGLGDWFRSITCLKGANGDGSKKTKVHSSIEKSNGVKPSYDPKNINGGLNGISLKNVKEISAIRIQKAFRAYMAKKIVNNVRGADRFNSLVQTHIVKKQTTTAIGHMHSWCKIQHQIRARRLCMVTQGRINQKKLQNQLKLEAKLNDLEVDWCGGSETMEETLTKIHQKEEASVKRERAMAYAFSHQWRANATQYLGQASFSVGKENWGWSWKERWIAARPWEIRVQSPKKTKTKTKSKPNNLIKQQDTTIKVTTQPATKPHVLSSNGTRNNKRFHHLNPETKGP